MTIELPIEWANIGKRIRAFTDFAEADRCARDAQESGSAVVAHSCRSDDGLIAVRMLLPHGAPLIVQTFEELRALGDDSPPFFSPAVAEEAGGWTEIIAVVESF